jgi:hypothetical protein
MALKYDKQAVANDLKKQLGPDCPELVVKALADMAQKNMVSKAKEISKAIDSISKAAGKNAKQTLETIGEYPILSELLVKNPDKFVEIAKLAGSDSPNVFEAMHSEGVADSFMKYPSSFVRLIKVAGNSYKYAMYSLGTKEMSTAFAKDPEKVINSFSRIMEYAGLKDVHDERPLSQHIRMPRMDNERDSLFKAIAYRASSSFAKHPDKFVEIAKVTGKDAKYAFNAFAEDEIKGMFLEDPDKVVRAFADVASAAGDNAGNVLRSIGGESFGGLRMVFRGPPNVFMRYCKGEINLNSMMFAFYSTEALAIEMGRPIDDMHEDAKKRKEYIDKLSTMQVIGLLMSNPEYFYTSSNHLLFDRVKEEMKKEGLNITDLIGKYGKADSEQYTNLVFRSINYDRFYGKKDSIFTSGELQSAMDSFFEPIYLDKFNEKYYFILANGLDKMKNNPVFKEYLDTKFEKRIVDLRGKSGKSDEEKKILSALEFLDATSNPSTKLISNDTKDRISALAEKGTFKKSNYSQDGKIIIVQVFDKEDTEKNHWMYTQEWFNGGKKQKEGPGKINIETKNAKIILFMGKDADENQAFITQQLKETPNLIITFRGHSYSLKENFPYDIFGDKDSHVLFIPGSCGSSGSIPEYISANKDTDIKFFSNTSTGRGQVTNAIIDVLIKTKQDRRFNDLLNENSKYIEQNGGDVSTIKVFSPGEMLLRYVFGTDTKLAMAR